MNKRNIVIVLLLVIIAVTFYLLFSQATENGQENRVNQDVTINPRDPNETTGSDNNTEKTSEIPAGWVVFQDTVAGYRLRHPPTWNTSNMESYSEESVITSFEAADVQIGQVPADEIKIAVRRFAQNGLAEYTPPEEDEIVEEKTITVAGGSAIWREIDALGTNISVELTKERDTYVISAYPADSQFIEEFETLLNSFEFIDPIEVSEPQPRTEITSPLTISGKAPGPWFFEASMSAELETQNGDQIGVTVLMTSEEWMTEGQVQFDGTMDFESQTQGESLLLIIRSANPSGMPENERVFKIPVVQGGN